MCRSVCGVCVVEGVCVWCVCVVVVEGLCVVCSRGVGVACV